MASLSPRFAFFKIALLSSSFWLIVIYVCIPALVWPNTGWLLKMWAVALVVQQPQKVLYQNMQTAMMHCSAILAAPPFLASDEFETNEIFPDIV